MTTLALPQVSRVHMAPGRKTLLALSSKNGGGEDTKPVIKICDRRTEGRNITRSDWGNSISIIQLFVCFTFR